ncbi:hypothetical protein Naga_101087g2 [Nannochloropsis gaditana]|uniref:Uncharacterized protein n=1 Tax=Nannochloropsis gaditana TaxID=72520 RepID=W7TIE0_9STRA|nr:hypothetical protein Naga_101087g2 [Nannochloropsis gaditana]
MLRLCRSSVVAETPKRCRDLAYHDTTTVPLRLYSEGFLSLPVYIFGTVLVHTQTHTPSPPRRAATAQEQPRWEPGQRHPSQQQQLLTTVGRRSQGVSCDGKTAVCRRCGGDRERASFSLRPRHRGQPCREGKGRRDSRSTAFDSVERHVGGASDERARGRKREQCQPERGAPPTDHAFAPEHDPRNELDYFYYYQPNSLNPRLPMEENGKGGGEDGEVAALPAEALSGLASSGGSQDDTGLFGPHLNLNLAQPLKASAPGGSMVAEYLSNFGAKGGTTASGASTANAMSLEGMNVAPRPIRPPSLRRASCD